MQLTVEITDYAPGTVLEGAFDQFEITGPLVSGIDKLLSTKYIEYLHNRL